MKKKSSTTKQRAFMAWVTLLLLCFLGPNVGAQTEILPFSPTEGSIYNTCDFYSPPLFQWVTAEDYKLVEIQFSTQTSPKTVKVKVSSPAEKRFQPTLSVWKKVFLLPGSTGGTVSWKIIGTRLDKDEDESLPLSFQIAAPQPVQDAVLSPTNWLLPTLTWSSRCQSKFKVWFGSDSSFTNSKSFSFKGASSLQGEESFTGQLTSKQWNAVRNLVGNRSGESIYWSVEAWDGLKRRSVAGPMDFVLDIPMDNLPPSVILDIPLLKTIWGSCYLNSFSSLIAYLDNSVTTEEVFAFAMIGAPISYSSYSKAFLPNPIMGTTVWLHSTSLHNYGAHFIVGHDVTGDDGTMVKAGATYRVKYSGTDEALLYLKALLSSGRPVQVHVDKYYLPSLTSYVAPEPGSSHSILVNGYDSDSRSIYVTETYSDENKKDQFKNVRIPEAEFMEAWDKGGKRPGIRSPAKTGPYWMLFLLETEGTQLNKASPLEILDMQREFSAQNEETIARYLNSDFSSTAWNDIAVKKELFADYLADNGYTDAANAYRQLAQEYWDCWWLKPDVEAQREKLLRDIAPLEALARTLY
jgi:hypothetical protein